MMIAEPDESLDQSRNRRHLPAQLRTRTGRVNQVRIVDLSIAGCLVERQAMALAVDDAVLVRLPGLSYCRATVAWVEDGIAALSFDEILHDAIFEHLQRSFQD
jgi:hypothetical protein